jgi:hypothetical protein
MIGEITSPANLLTREGLIALTSSDLSIDFATEPTPFPALSKAVSALDFGNRFLCEANIHKASGILQNLPILKARKAQHSAIVAAVDNR